MHYSIQHPFASFLNFVRKSPRNAPEPAVTRQPDTKIPPLETLARVLDRKVHEMGKEENVDRIYRLIAGSEIIITMLLRYYKDYKTRDEYWPKIIEGWEKIDPQRHSTRLRQLEEKWSHVKGDYY